MDNIKYYTKEEVKNIVSGAPEGYQPEDVVRSMINKGWKLEGLNATTQEIMDKKSAQDTGASFPSVSGKETKTSAALKTVGNIPSSAYQLGKGVVGAITSPIKTAKALGGMAVGAVEKLIPGEQPQERYIDALTGFLKDRYGSLENLQRTTINDPVGFATDIMTLISGGSALAGKAGALGTKISEIAKPVTKVAEKVTLPVLETAKEIGTGVIGATTGAGKEAIKQAIKGGSEFTGALRGTIDTNKILEEAGAGFSKIREIKNTEYTKALENIKTKNPQSFDITPIQNTAEELKNTFGIKTTKDGYDFSRSPLIDSQKKVEAVLNIVSDWGSKTADRTITGIDLLKQQLRKFREPTNPQLNILIDKLANSAKDVIKGTKGYAEMEANYGVKMELLDELGRTLSLKESATPDTAIRKLNSLITDKAEYRRELANEFKQLTDKDLTAMIAGKELAKWTPEGLAKYVTTGIGAGYLLSAMPKLIPLLAVSSPRIMGEFFRLAGISGDKTVKFLNVMNNYRTLNGLPIIKLSDIGENLQQQKE